VFPHASVAVQRRVIVRPPPHPAAIVSSELMVTPLQESLPVALPVADGLVSPVHSTIVLSGAETLGAVVSVTVIV
jgi:hypothetical protein